MSNVYKKVPRLIHCFGTEKNIVNIDMVVEMIKKSKNNIIPINTHNIWSIDNWKLLPIGYGNANWEKLSQKFRKNKLKSITEIGGKKAIKLEVLDSNHKWSNNEEVIKSVKELSKDGLEIWPLIAPNKQTIDKLIEYQCPIIRLLGSEISSGKGFSKDTVDALKYIKEKSFCTKVMLGGGVGCEKDVYSALINGFDSVLVNSYLYNLDYSPAKELERIVNIG